MKKTAIITLVIILLVNVLTACANKTPGGDGTTQPVAPTNTAAPTNTPQTSNNTLYGEGYNVNLIVGVDEFDRVVQPISSNRSNKQVGIFYWIWHGQHSAGEIYDNTKILAMEDGFNKLFKTSSDVSPANNFHWWGEPLYGYYNSADTYVIRKHMELLTIAGFDFIVFDATNALTYKNVYRRVLKVLSEMIEEGWNVPRAAFYTHSKSMDTVRELYKDLYSKDYCKETWYMVDGKPMIIAYTKPHEEYTYSIDHPADFVYPEPYSQEILDFFTFKMPSWPWDPVMKEGFPWCEWRYPQPVHGNVINVTVASHPGNPFSASITGTNNRINWGRGWDPDTQTNNSDKVNIGHFYQKSWDVALQTDPDVVFVGGWNEWTMIKTWANDYNEYIFVDNVSREFSRDIEPMKGGYNDAFYIQTIMNVRKYKGEAVTDAAPQPEKTIDINASPSQWDDVAAVYRSIGKTNYGRDSVGAAKSVKYEMDAPRNNIQEIKVSKDAQNIYFYVRAENDITAPAGNNWMNLFIGTGTPANKGWVCYDYVINRTVSGNSSSIEKLKSDYTGENVGSAQISIQGNVLQIAVPRSAIGLESSAVFYFKVADDVQNPNDIMDYYVTGKSLPVGRLSYQYLG